MTTLGGLVAYYGGKEGHDVSEWLPSMGEAATAWKGERHHGGTAVAHELGVHKTQSAMKGKQEFAAGAVEGEESKSEDDPVLVLRQWDVHVGADVLVQPHRVTPAAAGGLVK